VGFLLSTGGFFSVDRVNMLWFFYCILLGCLVERVAMLWVCYCETVACLVERAAML
jgi:hypothetical protein